MKKSFTLAEVLIVVAVIGVLAALLASTIGGLNINRDIVQYKKALLNVQTAITNATDELYNKSNPLNGWKDESLNKSDFCFAVAEELNTVGDVNCTEESSFTNPNFETTDGLVYWGFEKGFRRTNVVDENEVTTYQNKETVYVDYNMKNVDRRARQSKSGYDNLYGLKIDVMNDGKVTVDKDYTYELSLIKSD